MPKYIKLYISCILAPTPPRDSYGKEKRQQSLFAYAGKGNGHIQPLHRMTRNTYTLHVRLYSLQHKNADFSYLSQDNWQGGYRYQYNQVLTKELGSGVRDLVTVGRVVIVLGTQRHKGANTEGRH